MDKCLMNQTDTGEKSISPGFSLCSTQKSNLSHLIHGLKYCSTPVLLLLFQHFCWWSWNLFRLQEFFFSARSAAYLATSCTFSKMGLTPLLTFCSASVPGTIIKSISDLWNLCYSSTMYLPSYTFLSDCDPWLFSASSPHFPPMWWVNLNQD